MNKRYKFTLVELLVVIGIIAILAGLILGAVSLSQSSARNTQAKSDMASIILALRGVETTYGKLVNSSSSFDGKSATASGNLLQFGKEDDSEDATDENSRVATAYDCFIAELSVPKKVSSPNVNKRRIVFLEPRADFNPDKSYKHKDNIGKLWRDPWGNRYIIHVDANGEKSIAVSAKCKVATDIAIYSRGANGTDEQGCHADLDDCISTNSGQQHKLCDDIVSWRK